MVMVEMAEADLLLGDQILHEAAKRIEVRLVRRREQVAESARDVPLELRLPDGREPAERAKRLHEALHRAVG